MSVGENTKQSGKPTASLFYIPKYVRTHTTSSQLSPNFREQKVSWQPTSKIIFLTISKYSSASKRLQDTETPLIPNVGIREGLHGTFNGL